MRLTYIPSKRELLNDYLEAATNFNLALLYAKDGRYEEAEPLFARAVEPSLDRFTRRENVTAAARDRALILENYARLLRDTGRTEEATRLEERAKELRHIVP